MIELSDGLKRRMPFVFALFLGTLAVVLMQSYLGQQRRLLEQERLRLMESYRDPIQIVVAAKDLKQGVTLQASHLEFTSVPEHAAQPYSVTAPRTLLGLVTIAPIAKGEQVLKNKVRPIDAVPTGTILSSLTPEGKRAVTIGLDAMTGVGGFVRPGDKVDIMWTVKLPQPGSKDGQVVMLTLFQDVQVLAVGGQMLGRAPQPTEENRDYTVTLALDPQETSFLLFAREQGRIQLSLRSQREESAQIAISPTNINTVLEAKLGLKTAAPAKPTLQVEVFKGLKRDVVLLSGE